MNLLALIFDLDGTLGDTLPVCFHAFRHAFQQFTGRVYSDAEIATMFGPNEEGIIQRVVPNRWQECLECFLEAYEECHPRLAREFPGLPEALHMLRERGVRLAVVTGKGAGSAAVSLRHLGFEGLFDPVLTGSAGGDVKPASIRRVLEQWNLPANRVGYVGDFVTDMAGAKEAQVIPLAAAWAPTADPRALEAAEPHALFCTVEEFARWTTANTG